MSDKPERDMHEALDASLPPDAYGQLMQDVQADRHKAQTYRRLQDADADLKRASTQQQRVPDRLAMNIMSRIAQADNLPAPQLGKNRRALVWGLGITTALIFPLMLTLSLTVLALFGTTSMMGSVALGILGVALYLHNLLNGLVTSAGLWATQYPLLLAALLLIPIAVVGLRQLSAGWAGNPHD